MMKSKIFFSAILIILIAGCNSAANPPSTAQISLPSSTGVGDKTATPFLDSTKPPTVSINMVSTNTPDSGITTSCFYIKNGETQLQDLTVGTITLDKSLTGQLSLLDLLSGSEYKIPTQSKQVIYFGFQVSPNRSMLAYVEGLQNNAGQFDKMMLWVVNAQAEVLENMTFNLPGLTNMRWLDDQNLIFYTTQTSKDGTIIFFNPFTHEERHISNDLPDFYVENYFLPNLSWLVEYSPNLEWGVYLGRTETGKLGFVIRDFVLEQTVWQIEDTFGEYQKPTWSPNGENVVVIASGQLYIINRNGEAKSILNEIQQNQAKRSSWSPDGRYLAFWNFSNLTLYDSLTGQVIDICLKNEFPDDPIWSPDSRQFVINAYLNEGGMLVDLQKKIAYKLLTIPETLYPAGWMNSIP